MDSLPRPNCHQRRTGGRKGWRSRLETGREGPNEDGWTAGATGDAEAAKATDDTDDEDADDEPGWESSSSVATVAGAGVVGGRGMNLGPLGMTSIAPISATLIERRLAAVECDLAAVAVDCEGDWVRSILSVNAEEKST